MRQMLELENMERVSSGREGFDDFKTGDLVNVRYLQNMSQQRVRNFKGIVIAKTNKRMGSTFLCRNVVGGTAAELRFPLYSPLLKEIKVLQPSVIHKGRKRTRRSKLYYLRDLPLNKSTFK